jgi:hypothetical protein
MGATAELDRLYRDESSLEVREAILNGYMIAGQKGPVLRAALEESSSELREAAVSLLGVMGAGAELNEMYENESSLEIKEQILSAFMVSGDLERVFAAARNETGELREVAVNLIGVMGGRDELRELYRDPGFNDLREEILQAMFIGGDREFLGEVVRTERDPELLAAAIHALALAGGGNSSELLLGVYRDNSDVEVREAVLNGLFMQGNVKALISIAREETDRELKRTAVQYLSMMNSKESRDYMMELLND